MTAQVTVEDVRRRLRSHLARLRRRYGVRRLALFGSTARGEAGPASDVDLLVDFDEAPGLLGLVELEEELSRIVGRRVDLVIERTLDSRIAEPIRREHIEV